MWGSLPSSAQRTTVLGETWNSRATFYPSSMSWSEVAEPRPGRRSGRRSGDGQLLGPLLLGFGVVALLRESGVFQVKWEAILAGLLVTLGVGLVLTARTGRRIWP